MLCDDTSEHWPLQCAQHSSALSRGAIEDAFVEHRVDLLTALHP